MKLAKPGQRAALLKRMTESKRHKRARTPIFRFIQRVHDAAGPSVYAGDYEGNVEWWVREMYKNGAATKTQRDQAIAYIKQRRARNG